MTLPPRVQGHKLPRGSTVAVGTDGSLQGLAGAVASRQRARPARSGAGPEQLLEVRLIICGLAEGGDQPVDERGRLRDGIGC